MKSKIDTDKLLITLLFFLLGIFLLLPNETYSFHGSILILAILLYEFIVFDSREIYGFSGLKIVSIPSLAFASFTIFIALPSLYICDIYSSPVKYNYFFALISFYILFPIGLLFGDFLKTIDKQKIDDLRLNQFNKSQLDSVAFGILVTILILAITILFIYFLRVNTIPLFEMIQNPGSYFKLNYLRERALKLLPVTFIERYLFTWLRSLFFPLGIIGSLFLTVLYKKRKYIILFLTFFFLGVFNNSLTLEKSPTAAIFLGIMVFFYLKNNKLNTKFLIISIILVFSFPIIVMYNLHINLDNLVGRISYGIFHRLIIIPSEAIYYYFKIFPNMHDFLYGQSTQLLSWIYENGTFPLGNYVARIWWINPLSTGTANVNFIGYFWADFGWFGVTIGSFLTGLIIHLFYWLVLVVSNYKKNIIYVVSICISVPLFTLSFFSTNITTVFVSSGLIVLIVFLIYLKTFKNKNVINVL